MVCFLCCGIYNDCSPYLIEIIRYLPALYNIGFPDGLKENNLIFQVFMKSTLQNSADVICLSEPAKWHFSAQVGRSRVQLGWFTLAENWSHTCRNIGFQYLLSTKTTVRKITHRVMLAHWHHNLLLLLRKIVGLSQQLGSDTLTDVWCFVFTESTSGSSIAMT